MEKSFFFLPSLTARISCFGKQGLWGIQSVCTASWDVLGKMKPQAYPCDVCAGKHIRKRKELSAALAVLWARCTGLWGQWPVCLERNCSLPTWNGFTLAGWQMPTLLLGPLLRGAIPADNTWTDVQNPTSEDHTGCWSPSETPVAAHHTLETRTTDRCSAGLASFFVNRIGPQEILGGFCTCLCLFPFLNKAETLSGAFQFYVFLISQFSLIINLLVKTCLFWELLQTEYQLCLEKCEPLGLLPDFTEFIRSTYFSVCQLISLPIKKIYSKDEGDDG